MEGTVASLTITVKHSHLRESPAIAGLQGLGVALLYNEIMQNTTRVQERAWLYRALREGHAKRLRCHAGLTQGDLAEAVGASRATIASWEAGRRRPQGKLADAYADFLMRLSALVGDEVTG
jgi:DNA-binding XRE family transcriptional regulator